MAATARSALRIGGPPVEFEGGKESRENWANLLQEFMGVPARGFGEGGFLKMSSSLWLIWERHRGLTGFGRGTLYVSTKQHAHDQTGGCLGEAPGVGSVFALFHAVSGNRTSRALFGSSFQL